MKSKIEYGFLATAILIFGIGVEVLILKNEIKNATQEIEIQKLDCVIDARFLTPTIEIPDLNWEFESEYRDGFFELSAEDRTVICNIVAGEAKGESMEGKMAVAQCLLNAMTKEQMSAEEIRIKYKYSGWDSNLQDNDAKAWSEVVDAVSRVFDNGEFVSENPILFFYAPKYAKGKWHETLPHDQTIGNHKFFYLKEDVTADWFLNLKGEK